jgi:ectoine hydroxylase-related dioxygenase (phytanoyl-CoA dioxygenase family)
MTTSTDSPNIQSTDSPRSKPDRQPTLPLAPDWAADRELSEGEQDYLFDVYGYRVLHNVLSGDQVSRINAWVDRQDRQNLSSGDWIGDVEVHTYGSGTDGVNFQNVMAADEPVFQDLIDSPTWIDQVRRYIETPGHKLSIDECFLNVRQGGGYIPTHAGGDNVRFTGLFSWHNGKWAVGQINILMALTDIGPGDGGTSLIPASHKARFPHPAVVERGGGSQAWDSGLSGPETIGMCEVNMKAGDALMFTDGICHGSVPRINDGERRIMVYRYSPHLLANRLNYLPSDEFLGKLTDSQRQIVQAVKPKGRPGRTMTFEKGSGVGG